MRVIAATFAAGHVRMFLAEILQAEIGEVA